MPAAMRFSLWPQSLFGRLLAASVCAVLLAQAAGLVLIAQERERFVLQGSVREWSRRIAEITLTLQPLSAAERTAAAGRLSAAHEQLYLSHVAAHVLAHGGAGVDQGFVRLPLLSDFEPALRAQLAKVLGPAYTIEVDPTREPAPPAIEVPPPFFEVHELAAHLESARRYDVRVLFPDGGAALFRVTRLPEGAPIPRHLFINLAVLMLVLVIVLYVVARNITRPLSALAGAADRIGRDPGPRPLEERGARELRVAARAFNTMQDRLHRYLDSRTRVLAAMSHDLKTPLTRLRLQVEALDNPAMAKRISRELDEMEAMVREALALFRGVEDGEPAVPVDLNVLLTQLRQEFTDMGAQVTVTGHAQPYTARPQALRRCLTNLVANAAKFGTRADIELEDGPVLSIYVRDRGPGIPGGELERVFEPFYRLESSRSRDSGGTGLGLTIARDIAQAHGGSLTLRNLPEGGLEAALRLPRPR